MSQYFKDLISKLRNPSDAPKSEHHLFLLGTGVDYVDRPTDPSTNKSYIRGETFSYTAQLMTHLLGEQDSTVKYPDASNTKSPNYAHPYHSNSVDVINGADTPGFEVGDRLAKALMLALGAVAEGKTNLNISGFSRGGVESIVLTHELARVRDALEKDLAKDNLSERRTLATIIGDSKSVPGLSIIKDPSYTRKALSDLVTNEKLQDDTELKIKLLQNLKQLQVKLFVLDPVPGGNFGKVARIGWQEDYFYTLPEFVVQKHEFVQKHETSNCFKPIIPLGMPYEVIPGCHGTGDGNQFDHNGYPVPDSLKNRDLSGVQDLVLRRWIDFTFPQGLVMPAEIDLGHPALDPVTNAYLPANQSVRNQQLLDNYHKIQENYPAFEWLASRNYTGLGRYMAQRQVHYHQRGNTPITDLDAHGDGKTFLNLQHVKLWMANKLKMANFFDLNLVGQVQWLKDNIEVAFKPEDLSQSVSDQTHMIARLLKEKSNHPLVNESLSYLVNTVTQTYLRNHLSKFERAQCRDCVDNTFLTLKNAASGILVIDPVLIELAKSISKSISKDLTLTLLQHQNSLLSIANKLSREETAVLANISIPNSAETEESPMSWLMNTQKVVEDLGLLVEQIEALEPWCDKELLKQQWIENLPGFGTTPGKISFEKSKEQLIEFIKQQQVVLLNGASRILSNIPEALENKPEEMDRDFYTFIHRFANIGRLEKIHATTEKELLDSKKQVEDLLSQHSKALDMNLSLTKLYEQQKTIGNTLLEELNKKIEQIRENKNQFDVSIKSLQQQLDEKEVQLSEAHKQMDSTLQSAQLIDKDNGLLRTQITELKDEIQQLKTKFSQKTSELVSANEQVQLMPRQLSEIEKQVQSSKNGTNSSQQLVEAVKSIEQLNQMLEGYKKQLDALSKDFEKNKSELQQKADDLKSAQLQIESLKKELDAQKSIALVVQPSPDTKLKEQLAAYQSNEERAAIVKIDSLLKLTTDYLNHLNKEQDDNPLLEEKKEAVIELIGHLKNTEILPSQQLEAFNNKLLGTHEKIQEHRDPAWQRFFRDCVRILSLVVSGVGFYRMATNQSPKFFKPSKGEEFVDEALNISLATPSA